MIAGTEDTRYAFANGIIRAREARLLNRSQFDRLMSAGLESFSVILADTPYAADRDLLRSIAVEERKVREFFNKYCFHNEVRQLIDWPEQVHNLKVKIKNGSAELLYENPGSEVESWPEIASLVERYASDKDPFILSTSFDKILCHYLLQKASFAPFFMMFYQLNFDLENIRSFFRARNFENSRDIFEQVFISYGRIEYKMFAENLSAPLDVLGKVFFTTPYLFLIEKGGLFIEQNYSFLRLERLCEERRLEFLRQGRFLTFVVEPLFGYYQMKMSEMKKLRQVYWGKINEVPIDQLKESISDVW